MMNQEHFWNIMLPEFIKDENDQQKFMSCFFAEGLVEKREGLALGVKLHNRFLAESIFRVAIEAHKESNCEIYNTAEKTKDHDHGGSNHLAILVADAIHSKDHATFAHLSSIIERGGIEAYESTRSGDGQRWVIFCRFILKHRLLPSKSETKIIWAEFSNNWSPKIINTEVINTRKTTSQEANKWRANLGLQGVT
jgi:hypothetical protein